MATELIPLIISGIKEVIPVIQNLFGEAAKQKKQVLVADIRKLKERYDLAQEDTNNLDSLLKSIEESWRFKNIHHVQYLQVLSKYQQKHVETLVGTIVLLQQLFELSESVSESIQFARTDKDLENPKHEIEQRLVELHKEIVNIVANIHALDLINSKQALATQLQLTKQVADIRTRLKDADNDLKAAISAKLLSLEKEKEALEMEVSLKTVDVSKRTITSDKGKEEAGKEPISKETKKGRKGRAERTITSDKGKEEAGEEPISKETKKGRKGRTGKAPK